MLTKPLTTALAPIVENPYWREDDAARVLAVWSQSGLTLSAFARQCGLSVARLRRWRRRLEDGDGPRFHPVEIVDDRPEAPAGETSGAGVEVIVGRGHRIALRRGFDAALLREVVEALEGC